MLDVDQRNPRTNSSSLAQWVYNAIQQPGVCLRVRLRGNHLHILCESRYPLEAKTVVNRLMKALREQQSGGKLPWDLETPIYQIIIYGRRVRSSSPDWIKQIRLKHSKADQGDTAWETTTHSALIVANETLARSGSPEAIARYLSTNLNHLGVSVKVQIQELTSKVKSKQEDRDNSPSQRRLWVICNSNYSPDLSLLAEPLVEQLRSLELKGFRDGAICSQVSGEKTPEWMLRVDLTPAQEMLRDWARWGDVPAITKVLNQTLNLVGMAVRAILKEATLHLFCSSLPSEDAQVPDKQTAVIAIAPVLNSLSPQGIKAATIYGVESGDYSLALEHQTPIWVDWLNLPAAETPNLALSTFTLAQSGNIQALTFLLERLLNPNLDHRLATGGIQLKIRLKQDLLHIMSEAVLCPPQTQVGPAIARLLRQLALPKIGGVRVYGRRSGANSPEWNYGVDFIPRRRLVPETTPEFTSSDPDINALIVPTGELVGYGEVTKEDTEDSLRQVSTATVQTIQRWLCYSQLFVPTLENQDLTVGSQRSSQVNREGIKVAAVWGIAGLVLMFQSDWLLSQFLRFQTTSRLAQSPAVSTQESSAPISLPQVSLQQGGVGGSDNFNASGFTTKGQMSVIMDSSSNPARASATRALLAVARSPNPSFNNPLLDQKLALYQQRLLENDPPDVLIVGSSRALRGVDPGVLKEALAAQGYGDVDIYNFAVNGATAQVVDLMLRRILTPAQLPKLIIWADGSRAFNSGRPDVTYNAIANSEGYQQLNAGTFPNPTRTQSQNTNQFSQPLAALNDSYKSVNHWANQSLAKISATYPQRNELKSLLRDQFVSFLKTIDPPAPTPPELQEVLATEEFLDVNGFLPLSIRFHPTHYYQNHPRVAGAYDSNYESFQLNGKQDMALSALMEFAKAHQINIAFVNLPLTQDYLDPVRYKYEQQFQQYMHTTSLKTGIIFRDLSGLLLNKPDHFSDPSHLNRYGAYEVSNYLADDPMIPWSLVVSH